VTPLGPFRFPYAIDRRWRSLLRLFGVEGPETAWVDLDGRTLTARFGRFGFATPITNLVSWQVEGPWRSVTAIGVRRSIRHADITFGGTSRGGIRIDFVEPIQLGWVRPPAIYLTVEDPVALGAALASLGVHGRDVRLEQGGDDVG
jgi:hypothetical protein